MEMNRNSEFSKILKEVEVKERIIHDLRQKLESVTITHATDQRVPDKTLLVKVYQLF